MREKQIIVAIKLKNYINSCYVYQNILIMKMNIIIRIFSMFQTKKNKLLKK